MDLLSGVMENGWLTLVVGIFVLFASVILVVTSKSTTRNAEGAQSIDVKEEPNEKDQAAPEHPPDQCGLYDDGVGWVRQKAAERKRESEATPERKNKYLAMLRTIFSVPSLLGQRVDFDPTDVIQVAIDVLPYLNSEPALLEDAEAPLTIVGDLHGQLYDLNRVFAMHDKDGKPGYECASYLFLGNYVDKGRQSLEIVMALFILKILYPAKFFLLRGSHEFIEVNSMRGFAAEIKARFGLEAAKIVYALINTAFCWLSMCAIIGGKVFCVHAGPSTTEFNLRSLRNMRKPIFDTWESYLIHDLVWSDPADGLTGTCHNASRQSSVYLGRDAFAYAMHKIRCVYMIRAHSLIPEGARCIWNRIYSIITCTNMARKHNNMGAYVKLAADLSLRAYIMPVDEIRKKMEEEIFGPAHDDKTDDEHQGIAKMAKQ